ncbi:hypothetical protein A176_006484 [Myxococcus hansupus]|uniref:Uncharacterized protein n=1 Tax=Pseudomyxococcus hansupus TaxID=1297742 RepID=A0A0H4XMM1_9BACT|nr:hypothetical protein A176_006484 [Myxococcus hansupus]
MLSIQVTTSGEAASFRDSTARPGPRRSAAFPPRRVDFHPLASRGTPTLTRSMPRGSSQRCYRLNDELRAQIPFESIWNSHRISQACFQTCPLAHQRQTG